ncbi:MAG TPA: hypothetical protein EYG38_11560 [Verrucomicrobia bacterium]|nr:hypothetical protein [Verrucomicrobiota bacterium]
MAPTSLSNVSQGRPANDLDLWRFFSEPTPGKDNRGEGFASIAASVSFSHQAGSYPDPFSLELTGQQGDELRYTIDGAEPTKATALYESPLEIQNRSTEPNRISVIPGISTANQHTDGWIPPLESVPKAFTVRARDFRSGSLPGPIATRTYFVGLNPGRRWNLPVISLTTPPQGLFDFEKGIYVLGKVFDNYLARNPDEPLTGHTPANYTQRGPAWERAAHLEFFETDGSLGVRQTVSLDIKGQSSRSFRQKSFGIRPAGGTRPSDTFDYPFFPGLQRRGLGGERTEFHSLRLRNSGNDWDYTMLRDALNHRLIAPLGIDVMTSRPVVVFLNGEFWGLYNLREEGDLKSVSVHYGTPVDDLVQVEGDGRVKEGDPPGVNSYKELRRLADNGNLADSKSFSEVAALMDIDNFLRYQIAEIYIGNADWPHNNVRFWRHVNAQADSSNGNPGFDGKWRWMLFDTDLSYAHPWSGGNSDATLAAAISPVGRPGLEAPWSTALLRGLLNNHGFRNDFINTLAGDLNSVFRETRAQSLIEEMKIEIEAVMTDHIRRWRTMGDSINGWRRNIRIVDGFARQRPSVLRRQLAFEFGLSGTADVTVNVDPARAGFVTVHRLRLDSATPGIDAPVYPWEGAFFRDVPLTLRAVSRPGYAFSGWNGSIEGETTLETILMRDTRFLARFERIQSAAPLADMHEYRFGSWNVDSAAGTHPPFMRFEQTGSRSIATDANALMELEWPGPFNLRDRSRFVGLGDNGIGWRDTGRLADFPSSGFPGSVVLALDTRGLSEVTVAWTGATLKSGKRGSAMTLQMAVGDGPYADLLDASGKVQRYVSADSSVETRFPPLVLPAGAINQESIELRWRCHALEGPGGTGALIRLDDIVVTGIRDRKVAGEITGFKLVSPQRLILSFSGAPLTEFILQSSNDFESWQNEESFVTTATGEAALEVLQSREKMRFYRIASP